MKFLYTYRTPDNKQHRASIKAATKEAAYAILKAQGIKPGHVDEAPGLFNKLFGKGKRWIAIAVLGLACLVLGSVAYHYAKTAPRTTYVLQLDAQTRRQPIGDAAIIENGIRTGWADVFPEEGERFLASFAVPGVPAGLRNTSEDEIRAALARTVGVEDSDTIEARQIKAMVEGMKQELRAFLADNGTIVEYGKELVRRQEEEIGYYTRAKNELVAAKRSGKRKSELTDLWANRNAKLRRLGIKLLPMPE